LSAYALGVGLCVQCYEEGVHVTLCLGDGVERAVDVHHGKERDGECVREKEEFVQRQVLRSRASSGQTASRDQVLVQERKLKA
jgi:hypothetical protein